MEWILFKEGIEMRSLINTLWMMIVDFVTKRKSPINLMLADMELFMEDRAPHTTTEFSKVTLRYEWHMKAHRIAYTRELRGGSEDLMEIVDVQDCKYANRRTILQFLPGELYTWTENDKDLKDAIILEQKLPYAVKLLDRVRELTGTSGN